MSFSWEWDEQYAAGRHLSVWPWSQLISAVLRLNGPLKPGTRVLEIGCGAGANIPFFLKFDCDYHAIEGSPVIVEKLRGQFPACAAKLHVGDFTETLPEGPFDIIVDRGAVTHNHEAAIRRCLATIHRCLVPGGRYFGVDWFSTADTGWQGGVEAEDRHTRTDLTQGPMRNLGRCHFSDRAHLEDLLSAFTVELLEHAEHKQFVPASDYTVALWTFAARKGTDA